MKPPFYQKFSPLFFAGCGLLFFVGYFFIASTSPWSQLLHFQKTRDEILTEAQRVYDASPLEKTGMRRDYEISVAQELLQYAQQQALPESARAALSLARWEVYWRGNSEPDDENKKLASFSLEYDLSGKLVGLSQNLPGLKDSLRVSEAEAMRTAKAFLKEQSLDTAVVRLAQKRVTEEEQSSKYKFTFERVLPFAADLTEKFSIDVAGHNVTEYKRTVEKARRNTGFTPEDVSEIVVFALATILWIGISITVLVVFFRKFRHDEVEFKRAWWWGIAGGIVFGAAIAIQAWPSWGGAVFGGAFLGVFSALALVLIYATADTFARDACPEKMQLSDLVQRGQLRVQEIGAAILRAICFAGAALLVWCVLQRLAPLTGFGYFEIKTEDLALLRPARHGIAKMLSMLAGSAFIGLMLINFWPSYLQSKIRRPGLFVVLLMLSFNFIGFNSYFIRPFWLGAILYLPLAALWTYFVIAEDYLTSFVAAAIFHISSEFALPVAFSAMFSYAPMLWFAPGLLLLLGIGFLFYKTEHRAADFADYVPEYVSRIAARERFLKELEIARNVQMRFLPTHVPQFPGLELASICRPAMEVGGDYFDFVPHGKDAMSVFIGDVSGKGVSAAFFMTMAKGIIKTLVKRLASPKQLLTEMNEVFYENSPKEIFISLIYGYFDMNKRTLTFARAGHNPLIVRKSQGYEPELLHPQGLAIGMDSGRHFAKTIEEITVPLQPGDTLVFYTDGISESMNMEGEEFGEEKLCALVNAGVDESAAALLERITAAVNTFAEGAQQHDDFTMVVVKVLA